MLRETLLPAEESYPIKTSENTIRLRKKSTDCRRSRTILRRRYRKTRRILKSSRSFPQRKTRQTRRSTGRWSAILNCRIWWTRCAVMYDKCRQMPGCLPKECEPQRRWSTAVAHAEARVAASRSIVPDAGHVPRAVTTNRWRHRRGRTA